MRHIVYDILDDLSKKLLPLLQLQPVDLDEQLLAFWIIFINIESF